MSALQIAIDKLVATAGVTAITTAAGIYPEEMPQNALMPCIVVNIVSGQDEHMLTGAGGYYRHRVSVECNAANPLVAQQLGNAVMAALQTNVNATIGDFTGVSTSFADTELTGRSDDRSASRRILDFFIRWRF